MTDAQEVYIVGSPRSGTSWLQKMLASHPVVASPRETFLYSAYVAPGFREYDLRLGRLEAAARELDEDDRPPRPLVGLPVLLHRHELEDWVQSLVSTVRARTLELKPGATVFVEKTPNHSLVVDLIGHLRPEARFLHLVRDPRDVVASLLRASSGWGSAWAPSDVGSCCDLYARYVSRARASGAALGERFRELRFEDLRAGGLDGVLGWLGLPPAELDDGDANLVVGGELERFAISSVSEPREFGTAPRSSGGSALTRYQRAVVETVLADFVAEYDDGSRVGRLARGGRRRVLGRAVRKLDAVASGAARAARRPGGPR